MKKNGLALLSLLTAWIFAPLAEAEDNNIPTQQSNIQQFSQEQEKALPTTSLNNTSSTEGSSLNTTENSTGNNGLNTSTGNNDLNGTSTAPESATSTSGGDQSSLPSVKQEGKMFFNLSKFCSKISTDSFLILSIISNSRNLTYSSIGYFFNIFD